MPRKTIFVLSSLVALSACVPVDEIEPEREPVVVVEPEEPRAVDGKADQIAPPSDPEEPEEPVFAVELPLAETIQYKKQYADCMDPLCVMNVKFALRGGIMTRFEPGEPVEFIHLTEDDFDRIKALADINGELMNALRDGDLDCPEPDADYPYNASIRAEVFFGPGDTRHFEQDVSGCYKSRSWQLADEFIEAAEHLYVKYKEEE